MGPWVGRGPTARGFPMLSIRSRVHSRSRTNRRPGQRGGRVSVLALLMLACDLLFNPALAAPPTNDSVAAASVIDRLPFTATADLGDATIDLDDEVWAGCSTDPVTATVWWRYRSAYDSAVEANLSDPVVGHALVATGSPGAMTLVDCFGQLPVPVEAGATYYIGLATTVEVQPGTDVSMTLFDAVCNGAPGNDYDGDGCPDLAVGWPAATVDGHKGAGMVDVAYGNSYTTFTKERASLHADAERGTQPQTGAGFGSALATGYLDEDRFTDLAIGIPGQDTRGGVDAGSVLVLFGGVHGLGNSGWIHLLQGQLARTGGPEPGDRFGASLAVSDHTLLVGAPGEDVGAAVDAGAAIHYTRFTRPGTLPKTGRFISQSGSVAGTPEAGDRFGTAVALAVGLTIVVGAPGEDIGTARDAGAVVTITGSGASTFFSQQAADMPGVSEAGDHFGAAVEEIRDTDGDGFRIAIGVPGEDLRGIRDAGTVNLLVARSRTDRFRAQPWDLNQSSLGVPGVPEAGDHFGTVLSTQDNPTQETALLVGVPDEDLGSTVDAGSVVAIALPPVVTGSRTVIATATSQASPGVAGLPERGDRFGASLTALASADAFADASQGLYVGVPGEDYNGITDAGSVQGIFASYVTLLPIHPETGGRFGSVLKRD